MYLSAKFVILFLFIFQIAVVCIHFYTEYIWLEFGFGRSGVYEDMGFRK